MSAYLMVDASCDLPEGYLEENNIGILPIQVNIAGQKFMDNHDPDQLRAFYKNDLLSKDVHAISQPWSPEQISQHILENVVEDNSSLLIETLSRERSKIFENAHAASFSVIRDYKNVKNDNGRFTMRVMDSSSVFTGMGVLVMHSNQLVAKGYSASQLRQEVEDFKKKLWVYGAPKDVKYLRSRIKQRGDKSISWMGAHFVQALEITPIICAKNNDTFSVGKIRGFNNAIDTLFDQVATQVKAGLAAPYVLVSIAGLTSELEKFKGYKRLQKTCKDYSVQMNSCMMSMSGAVNLGKGAITVGFASDESQLSF